ncbi:MAG: amino acid ABC transporter ATP-binding/permease protein [Tropicimonas sp.]|uniref:amino acid ABC transporter ATP-binding/permease protein n=1 Tax=Tropicimonas sp. TaxID=2067044 RepID=UPI003A8BD3B3
MKPVLHILRLLLGAAPWAMVRGAALAVVVLLMGAALLGLSGWFITATGLAGLAGIGIAFDVFRPSAGVRFLALGRTAARYGERLLTHDATLRALAALRVAILRGHGRLGARALTRLRQEAVLTRIVADVDALDGLILRLALPVMAALITHLLVACLLVWLVGVPVALSISTACLPLSALVLWRLARRTLAPSDAMERTGQSLRRGVIDMIRDREALILSGQLPAREEALVALDRRAREASARLDRADRDAGLALSLAVALTAAAGLGAGGWLLARGAVDPARAVIGLFVALALAETILPLRRGFGDLGRMLGAARRIAPTPSDAGPGDRPRLEAFPELKIARAGIVFHLGPGRMIALTGPSGAGKSTLLQAIAGLDEGIGITIAGRPPAAWEEASFRASVALLPQRSALMAGTVRDNLSMAGPVPDRTLWQALETVALADAVRERGGLDACLGEGGAGLSGGQARRLALARVLLRKPALLLLDEPTEGLDAATATAVLSGLRAALPDAAIVVALHRGAGHPGFDARFRLVPG